MPYEDALLHKKIRGKYLTWCDKTSRWVKSHRPIVYDSIEEAEQAFNALPESDKPISEIVEKVFDQNKARRLMKRKLRPADYSNEKLIQNILKL